MLLIYDLTTGAVLDNTGTNSAWPEGPPDDLALVNLPDRTPDDVGLLRLHDIDDAELVNRVLTNRHHVDLATGEVVIDGPYLEPQPPAPDPTSPEYRLAAVENAVDTLILDSLMGGL